MRLIEAPDLTFRKRLIEAPDLTGKVKVAPKDELAPIRSDIAKLNKVLGQIVKTGLDTAETLDKLAKEREAIGADLDKLNDKVKEISDRKVIPETNNFKGDIEWITEEIDKLNKKVTAEASKIRYTTSGGGISVAEAVTAVKADGGIVLTSPPEGYKRVSNIYIEPQTGVLVGEQEV